MISIKNIQHIVITFAMIFALSACGGGGGNSAVENNNATTPQSLTALEKVKEIITGNTTVTVSADELNSIAGIDGAIAGKDYTSALRHGTYADSHNPTVAEIQAVIDYINQPPVNHAPTITGTPNTAIQANNLYTFIPIANDDDNDTLTFSITNKPTWASFNTATGKLSGTPSNADVGITSDILISVSDGVKNAVLNTFTITVKETNKAPTITGTPSTSINADSSYTFTPNAKDSDNDGLAFYITNKPNWATFDTATGKLSGTPSNADAGITSGIVISVSDGTVSAALPAFSIEVKYVNHAPTITGTPATAIQADNLYTFIPKGLDQDNTDTLTFSITNKPSWASFDTATGKLSGTPSNADVGTTSNIVISVSDKIKKTSLPSFNITVKLTNHAPTIAGTPSTSINADSSYTFIPNASDTDSADTLTFSITNKPSWATFDTATGKLSGTPSNANAGITSGIVISVSDGTVSAALPAFSIEVKHTNHAPTITGTPSTSINADSSYTFIPNASDTDSADTLTFSITNKPSWATFDTATGKLSGTPSNADAGITSGIVISVSDGTVSAALPAFSIEVKHTNHAPTITGTPSTSINADSSYTFTPNAKDSDNDGLAFYITNKPNWATFDTATGKLSGTPSNADAGITSGIVISVSDGTVSAALPAFSIEVIYHVVSCGSNSDKGYSIATSIPAGKEITKVTPSANIRLWHTSDGHRKICVVDGEISVQ